MLDKRFSRSEFLGVVEDGARTSLCSALGEVLSRRIRQSPAFGAEARACVAELRALGHDLWSFDESTDFQIWCPNYAQPTGPGIIVTFTESEDVVVEWSTGERGDR